MSSFIQDPITNATKTLGMNDTFSFSCRACGSCCRNRTSSPEDQSQINLSGPDLYRIARYKQVATDGILKRYIIIGDVGGLPICILKFRDVYNSCIFFRHGICEIHEARPRTCALYPIGRGVDFIKKGAIIQLSQVKYYYAPDDMKCGESSTGISLREWLGVNNVPEEDKEDIEWFRLFSMLSLKQHQYSRAVQIKLLYEFDTNMDLLPQIETKISTL